MSSAKVMFYAFVPFPFLNFLRSTSLVILELFVAVAACTSLADHVMNKTSRRYSFSFTTELMCSLDLYIAGVCYHYCIHML